MAGPTVLKLTPNEIICEKVFVVILFTPRIFSQPTAYKTMAASWAYLPIVKRPFNP